VELSQLDLRHWPGQGSARLLIRAGHDAAGTPSLPYEKATDLTDQKEETRISP